MQICKSYTLKHITNTKREQIILSGSAYETLNHTQIHTGKNYPTDM